MPKKRNPSVTLVEAVRITQQQAAYLDALVEKGMFGSTRGDVIRYFLMNGLAQLDERKLLKPKGPEES